MQICKLNRIFHQKCDLVKPLWLDQPDTAWSEGPWNGNVSSSYWIFLTYGMACGICSISLYRCISCVKLKFFCDRYQWLFRCIFYPLSTTASTHIYSSCFRVLHYSLSLHSQIISTPPLVAGKRYSFSQSH